MNFALVLILFSLVTSSPKLHKFEDGFVERTCAVVIEENKGTIQYQIGLNENTIQELLAEWEKAEKPNEPETKTAGKLESGTKPSKTDLRNPKPSPIPSVDPKKKNSKSTDSNEAQGESEKGNKTSVKEPTQPVPTTAGKNKTQSDSQIKNGKDGKRVANPKPTDEEDVISKEALDKFKALAGSEIGKRFKIVCDGKVIPVELVSSEKAPRHPFVLRLNFKFELPQSDSSQLEIADKNFPQQTGAVRYALKVTKETILLKSNVAPIVVRAKRVELKGLSVKERAAKTSISARLARMSNSK